MTFSLPDFAQKDVVFVGKGIEGLSFKSFIEQHGDITSFRFVDKKTDPHYLDHLSELDLDTTIVVKTPGCPGYKLPVPYTTPTRVFFDCATQANVKTIGITGTKGKSTTASLLAHTLKLAGRDARLCGNIGKPMLDQLANAGEQTIMVVELSSYQLAELEQSPEIAIITNLFHDHIDYHGSLGAYWEAKRNIMRHMNGEGVVIFDPSTEKVKEWLQDSPAKKLPIDPNEQVDMSQTELIGNHNRLNYLLVKEAASLFGIGPADCFRALNSFEPIPHRLQTIRTVRGVTFVDDAIGSTPEATVAGITALIHSKGPIGCVLLGGNDRNYDYGELAKLLYRIGIPKLVLFPDTGAIIESLLHESYKPEILHSQNMDEAVKWAVENTPSGSICLLSTAAPSTVLWKSFEDKGDHFQKAVKNLPS